MFADSHMSADIDRAELAPIEPSIAEMTAKGKGTRIAKLYGVSPQKLTELWARFARDVAEEE